MNSIATKRPLYRIFSSTLLNKNHQKYELGLVSWVAGGGGEGGRGNTVSIRTEVRPPVPEPPGNYTPIAASFRKLAQSRPQNIFNYLSDRIPGIGLIIITVAICSARLTNSNRSRKQYFSPVLSQAEILAKYFFETWTTGKRSVVAESTVM
jgi:hypothetical protein